MKKKISIILILSIISSLFAPYINLYADKLEGLIYVEWQRNFGYEYVNRLRGDTIPVVDKEGNVYVVDERGYLSCIKPNKELKYEVNIYQQTDEFNTLGSSSPVIDSKSNVYIASADKNIYAFKSDGTKKWGKPYTMDNKVTIGLKGVLSPDEKVVYMADINGRIYALNTDNGELIWKTKRYLGYGVSSPILSDDGETLYIASNYYINAFDTNENLDKGVDRLKWSKSAKRDAEDGFTFNITSSITGLTYEKFLSIDEDENVYCVSRKFKTNKYYLHKFTQKGEEQWRVALGASHVYVTPPVYYNGYLYYKTSENKLFKLNPLDKKPDPQVVFETFEEAYTDIGNFTLRTSPVIKDGKFYTNFGKNIYIINLNTEKILRKSSQDDVNIKYLSIPTTKGEIYASDGERTLSKFKDATIKQIPANVEFKDKNFIMQIGNSYIPELTVIDQSGYIIREKLNPIFTSDNSSVVKIVDNSIEAVGIGKANINVNIEGVSAKATVEVLSDISSAKIKVLNTTTSIGINDKLKLKATAQINGIPLKGEKVFFRSKHKRIADVTQDGLVTGINQGIAKIETYLQNHNTIMSFVPIYVEKVVIKEVTHEEIKSALTKSMEYYRKRQTLNEWDVFAVNAAGVDVNTLDKSYVERIKNKIKNNNGSIGNFMTDYERTAIGLLSAGQDVTHFVYDDRTGDYIDFIKEIRNGAGAGISQGINAAIWGLIALNCANYDENNYINTEYDKDFFIDYILKNKSGCGWSFGGGSGSDPDMTGMALYALAPYRNRQNVKSVGEKAIKWLSEQNQLPNGKFGSWGTVNSCSISQVIMGLTSWGINPQGQEFTKPNGNVLTAFMSYYLGNGTFAYTSGYDAAFGTPQAIQALTAINDYFESNDDIAKRRSDVWENIQYVGKGEVKIKSIDVRPENLILIPNNEIKLMVITDNGSILENDKLKWSSTNNNIITIDNGVIKALKEGEVFITAEYMLKDGTIKKDQIKVIVADSNEFEIVQNLNSTIKEFENPMYAFNVTNNTKRNINAVFMVNLFEYDRGSATEKLIQQVYIEMDFEPQVTQEIAVSFDIPKDNKIYNVRVMLWDQLSTARSLNDYLEIKGVK